MAVFRQKPHIQTVAELDDIIHKYVDFSRSIELVLVFSKLKKLAEFGESILNDNAWVSLIKMNIHQKIEKLEAELENLKKIVELSPKLLNRLERLSESDKLLFESKYYPDLAVVSEYNYVFVIDFSIPTCDSYQYGVLESTDERAYGVLKEYLDSLAERDKLEIIGFNPTCSE